MSTIGSLFEEGELIDPYRLVERLPLADEFREVLRGMANKGMLDELIGALILSGVAKSVEEAILYLHDLPWDQTMGKMAMGDFSKSAASGIRGRLRRGIERACTIEDTALLNGSNIIRMHGVAGHEIMRRLIMRALPMGRDTRKFRRRTSPDQMVLILPSSLQLALPLEERRQPSFPHDDEVFVSGWIKDGYLERLKEHLALIMNSHKAILPWHVQRSEVKPLLRELRRLLKPIFGKYVDRLRVPNCPELEQMELMTLMSWVRMIIWVDRLPSTMAVFSELQALHPAYGVSQGRIDAFCLKATGKGRTAIQRQLRAWALADLQSVDAGRGGLFASVGDVMRKARELGSVYPAVYDWKFQFGDDPSGKRAISPTMVKDKPFSSHYRQGMRYSVVSWADTCLLHGWTKSEAASLDSLPVELVYIFAENRQKNHAVIASAQDREEVLKGMIEAWDGAEANSLTRSRENYLVSHVIASLEGKRSHRKNPQRSQETQVETLNYSMSSAHTSSSMLKQRLSELTAA